MAPIGGCCGTADVHLAAMRAALDEPEAGALPPSLAEIEAALGPVVLPTSGQAEGRLERRRRRA